MNASRLIASLLVILLLNAAAALASPATQPRGPRNVAVLVFPGVELLDFAGPTEAFSAASTSEGPAFKVYTVGPSTQTIRSGQAVTVIPQYSIDDCPSPAILVIPGGNTAALVDDARLMQWIRSASASSEITMTVCTGAFALADQGLLDGLEATTHHSGLNALRREHPSVRVREDLRVVDNGKIVTTAGISAGIDGAMHVISRLCGEESAWLAARTMEYNWQPPPLSGDEDTPARRLEREALGHRVFGRWTQAADAYRKLAELKPNDADVMIRLAQCELSGEQFDKAIASANRARELAGTSGGSDPRVLAVLARAYLGVGRNADAAKTYEQLIAAGQSGPFAYYNLACAYSLSGQKDKALEALRQALDQGPWMKKQAQHDEDLLALRDDPRFKAMVAKSP
jgi:putative intracellular protease/amidase